MNPSLPRRTKFAAIAALPVVVAASLAGLAAPSNAAAGTPAPGTVVYQEGFENGTNNTAILLPSYTGTGGQTYSADPAWTSNCNGIIADYNTTTTVDQAPFNPGCNQEAQSSVRRMASALGTFAGSADPGDNHVLAAYTQANPGANLSQLKSQASIPVPAGGRFLALAVDGAAMNCTVASAPQYAFFLGTFGSTLSQVGSNVDGCGGLNISVAGEDVNVQTYQAGGASLFSGSTAQIELRNPNGSGGGNDGAVDNFRLIDVTPKLDQAITTPAIQPGQTTTLTLTVTNTDELGAKNGWGFADSLPAGVTLTGAPAGGTCVGTVTGNTAGSNALTVTDGALGQGESSCTITVEVTAADAGSYTNDPANFTTTGLDKPDAAVLDVAPVVGTPMINPVVGSAIALVALLGLGGFLLRRRNATV